MTICYLSLGSNIEAAKNLRRAIALLAGDSRFQLQAVSPCYETSPWGITEQPAFLNLVVQGDWGGNVATLLQLGQQIEGRLDRIRREKNGPRTIDIDILLFGDERHHSERLTVPHPGLFERDFMLMPLLDVSPEATVPGTQQPLREFVDRLPYRCIRREVPEEMVG